MYLLWTSFTRCYCIFTDIPVDKIHTACNLKVSFNISKCSWNDKPIIDQDVLSSWFIFSFKKAHIFLYQAHLKPLIFGITIITNKNNTQRVHNLCCPSRPAMKTIHGKIPLYYSFINNSLSDHLHQKIQVIWALQKNFLYPKDTAPKLFFKFYNQYLSNAVFVNWNHFLDVFIHFLYS